MDSIVTHYKSTSVGNRVIIIIYGGIVESSVENNEKCHDEYVDGGNEEKLELVEEHNLWFWYKRGIIPLFSQFIELSDMKFNRIFRAKRAKSYGGPYFNSSVSMFLFL